MKTLIQFGMMALILTAAVEAKSPPDARSDSATNPGEAATARTHEAPQAEGRKLGEFTTRHGFRRVYILVPKGLDQAQAIALAQAWHQREPDGWLWLLDDDSKFDVLMETLPLTEQGDVSRFPSDWVAKHAVANLTLALFPDRTRRWVLLPGVSRDASAPIAELPCIDGKGGCKP